MTPKKYGYSLLGRTGNRKGKIRGFYVWMTDLETVYKTLELLRSLYDFLRLTFLHEPREYYTTSTEWVGPDCSDY